VHDLLNAGLLFIQDVLVVEGNDGRQQTATITLEGKINVAGQLFDAVSPAALKAMELAGKLRKAINGWVAFRVLRGGNFIGTLLEIRSQYEDREQHGMEASISQNSSQSTVEGPDSPVLFAGEQLKPLLVLLPELTMSMSKATISLYIGKLLVGYAYPRKRGLPRIRIYTGDTSPEWTSPDPTYAAWCNIDDWAANMERVTALFKDAPRLRAEDMAAGRDAYRRRTQPPGSSLALSPE
jgi:hypothetical protein